MTRVAWLDVTAGAAGDMLLGALVGAGVPVAVIDTALNAVSPHPIPLHVATAHRAGLAATKVHPVVDVPGPGRHWRDIRTMLTEAALDEPVRRRALDVFGRLAAAEARAHGVAVDDVHFHEAGALDAIADVVGVVAGFAALRVDRVVATPVTVGSGRTATGLPVPVPAVLELLAGAPVTGGDVAMEACTPTGAALLASLVDEWGPMPPMQAEAVGVGAGTADPPARPNVVRLVVGEADGPTSLLLEANVDDLDPRLWPGVLAQLLQAGAADAWLTPILMKKGRPAHTLHVLVDPAGADEVRRVVFTETSTIGLRESAVVKHALERAECSVQVGGQPVRVKTATFGGAVVNVQPEFDDVRAAAAALGRPVKAVLAEATAAALHLAERS